jgi:Na+/H+ antiporter NhaD/arsenite permease-like protein
MELAIVVVFLVGYILIALEHQVRMNKTASALLTAVVCWTLFIFSTPSDVTTFNSLNHSDHASDAVQYAEFVVEQLGHHLQGVSEILFFLLGAMTIVELIDAYQGFNFVTSKIKTKNPKVLLWIVCWLAFVLSALLDNLTTTIVMISLTRKLIVEKEARLFFTGMIIIAANAGGAWTPIGDVTTSMLWIGGQISSISIIKTLLIPSLVCMLVPLTILTFTIKKERLGTIAKQADVSLAVRGGKWILVLGIGIIVCVPLFKMITHLPPYVGMLGGLGILWVVSEMFSARLDEAMKKNYTAAGALSRIDVPTILFFLGILLAVGALESMGTLLKFSEALETGIGNTSIIVTLTGLISAIVDNVPLVAAYMGMYDLQSFPTDHFLWEYLAYCAGTGGSILIIGSAAGVAAMGIEKVEFMWYLKKISWLALLGYLSGALIYLFINGAIH